MEEPLLIEWDDDFTEPPTADFPQFAAYCIMSADDAIADGGNAYEVILGAIGAVSAYACGIPDDDLGGWALMLDYCVAKMRHDG